MLEKAIQNYYIFFDETLESTTFIVLIITLLIFIVGFFIPHANADNSYYKASSFDTHLIKQTSSRIMIDGVEYEMIFSKVR